ncbi:putative Acidic mammalian chitinase [Hypsibius exemplaris]|uniref:Metalloendopeptidase n=1 Tax=Hypsibius exemplaris TaxID=2072580 RepID=A0A9X6NJB3_HYPEX|nr:putative Acidic mammalian chitinase [Hypsibius exemplaris]
MNLDLTCSVLILSIFVRNATCAPVNLPTSAPLLEPPADPIDTEDFSYFEGDILGVDGVSVEDLSAMNGRPGEKYKWPNAAVPFVFSQSYEETSAAVYKKVVLDAMKGFNRTCIRFVPRTNERDYIVIGSSRSATCSSFVGKDKGGQRVTLSIGACTDKLGKVQHELMHALGFFHEQSRLDRDDYVEINLDNVKPADEVSDDPGNFKKYLNTTAFGQPYDFGSVLHYGMFDFAVNRSVWTIRPLPKYKDKEIGQRNWLSKIDIAKINAMYNCATTASPATSVDSRASVTQPSTATKEGRITSTAMATKPPILSTTERTVAPTTRLASAGATLETPHRGCVLPSWSPELAYPTDFKVEDVDPTLCTYIVIPFESSTRKELSPRSTDAVIQTLEKLQKLKFNNPRLKLILSVGGKTSDTLGKTANNRASTNKFMVSILRDLRKWGLDGLDVDFNPRYTDKYDASSMPKLLTKLRSGFDFEARQENKPRLLLTTTVHYTPISSDIDAVKLEQTVDLVHVAAYDLGSTVTETKVASHHSPTTNGPFGAPTQQNMESMAEALVSLGLSKSKLILGIPFYGHGWLLADVDSHGLGAPAASRIYSGSHSRELGVWAYYEICQAIKAESATNVFNKETAASYAYTTLWWIGYNDVQTVRTKTKWIKDNKYGGVYARDISEDDSQNLCEDGVNPLLNAIKETFRN